MNPRLTFTAVTLAVMTLFNGSSDVIKCFWLKTHVEMLSLHAEA